VFTRGGVDIVVDLDGDCCVGELEIEESQNILKAPRRLKKVSTGEQPATR
jgi:hypothetical protein